MTTKIKVTMTEHVTYVFTYTAEELIEHLPLVEGTTTDALAALVSGDAEAARAVECSDDTIDAVQDALEDTLFDHILNHYDRCTHREWTAVEVEA